MSHEECLKDSQESEKNPKQILLDWVENVKDTAAASHWYLIDQESYSKEVIVSELRDTIANILGQCEAMLTVLKNSN